MYSKISGTIAAVLLISSIALAQTYSIRVTHYTNLRASPSLQSRVVETAPAGTTLAVVGSNGRWLQINRNGNELWMADWVAYTRVDDSPAAETQTASNIDNCCFVDRQCGSDQEWTDGYWAFQNGQCAAPSQTQTSSQPATAATSEVDNCCFVDRQCNSDQEWTDGFRAFQNGQCAAPAQAQTQSQTPVSTEPIGATSADTGNCCFVGWQCHSDEDWQTGFHAFQNNQCKHRDVTIEGSGPFVARVEAALGMLKTRAPYWYTFATSGIDRIKEAANAEVTVVYVDAGEVNIIRDRAFRDELHGDPVETAVMWLASLIVKDACHIDQFRTGMPYSGLEGERTCLVKQIQAKDQLDPHNRVQFGLAFLLENIENPEYQWWN